MRFPIPSLIGAPILALVLLPSATAKPATIKSELFGQSAAGSRRTKKSRGPTQQVRATIASINPTPTGGPQAANPTASPPVTASRNPGAASPAPTAAEVWNEAVGALAAKILDHATSGNALALSVKNISSLEDDEVAQVRRALRSQLRSRGARLIASKQANADVQVTLSENTDGYLWIAEIRDHSTPTPPGADAANTIVMVPVARAIRTNATPPLSL